MGAFPPEPKDASDSPLAVIGAGFLGREVARRWAGPVIATTRSGQWDDATPPPSRVKVRALDLCRVPLVIPDDLQAARHCLVCVAAGRHQDRRAVYVEGTRALLAQLDPRTCTRIVFISSTSALPDVDGWVDESTPSRDVGVRGQVQREAEATVEQWAAATGVPWLVLRLGGLYGPHRDLGAIYRNRTETPLPGHGHVPTNLIHRDDACTAALAALRAPPRVQGIVHVVDDDHTPRRTMYDALASARGWTPVRWSQPVPPGMAPVGKRVSNHAMKTLLGVALLHPHHLVRP